MSGSLAPVTAEEYPAQANDHRGEDARHGPAQMMFGPDADTGHGRLGDNLGGTRVEEHVRRRSCEGEGIMHRDFRAPFRGGRTGLRPPLLAGAALLTMVSAAAAAQEPQEEVVDEVLIIAPRYVPDGSVSATKSDIPLIETPQSVTVITRDQIDLLNFIDGQQAVRYTAGVSGENFGPDLRFDFINVRGFTPKQYIDGLAAPISTSIYSVGVDLYAFETLDILKGPSSVLYGNAPPGGIYNQMSRRAPDELDGELQVKLGTTEYAQVAGTLGGPITDALQAGVTLLYRDREADRDFVQSERFLIAPTATVSLGDATTLTALFYYQNDDVEGDTNGFLPVLGTLEPNPNGEIDRGTNLGEPDYNRYRRNQWGAGWDLTHEFTDTVNFQSNTKWSRYDEDQKVIYGGGGLGPDNRTVFRFNFPYAEEVDSFATDNRLSARFVGGAVEHKLLAGVDYRQVGNLAQFGFGPASSIDLYAPVYNAAPIVEPPLGTSFGFPVPPFNNQRLKQTGFYVQDQLRAGSLYVTLGARFDDVRIRNRTTSQTTKQDDFTWRVGLNYILENGIAPYVSYATSFEPVLGSDSITQEEFDPSEGKQIEAGVKYDGRALGDDVRVFASAAIYRIEQSSIVSTSPSVTPVFGTQSGEVEVKGGELELVTRFRDRLSINASYSYTDSEVTESAFAPEIGAPLPVTPRNKVSLFVDYVLPQGPLAGLGFGAGVRYSSESAGTLPGAFNPVVYVGDDPVLVDAIVRYDTPEWRFAINGSNILDEKYVARCTGPAGCNFGAARQVIGTVTRKF